MKEINIHGPVPSIISNLRDKLIKYGYNESNINGKGIKVANADSVRIVPLIKHKCKEKGPLNTLIKLFLSVIEIGPDNLREVFNEGEIKQLIDTEIFRVKDEVDIQSNVKIQPYKNFLFFCDSSKPHNNEGPVYSPGNDTIRLAELGVRIHFDSVLDLCTGTGIQAILASDHSKHVVGIDLNPRAIYLARLNLILNNIKNVEFILGNLYGPVHSRKFDLITANPPFVISPSKSALYRDGGERGDDVLKLILNGLHQHLKKDGFCQIVTMLSEFEDFSHDEYIKQFANEHGYKTMIIAQKEYNSGELAISQHSQQIRNYKKYTSNIYNLLAHLDDTKFKKGYLGTITFQNNCNNKFKKIFDFDGPVYFDNDHLEKFNQFFELQ